MCLTRTSVTKGPDTVAPGKFRELMSTLASSVVVVGTQTPDRRPVGLTVSSIASLSLSPPSLLICLDHSKYTAQAIKLSGVFSVNILSSKQQELATSFASSTKDKFSNVSWKLGDSTAAPLITGSLTHVECILSKMIPYGDHVIIIGDVCGGSVGNGLPLMYSARKYLTWLRDIPGYQKISESLLLN